MKIAIAGTGYVGLSNAVLLAQHNDVMAVDLVREKVDMINQGRSPLVDKELELYLSQGGHDEKGVVDGKHPLHLVATLDGEAAYRDADYVIISTPTNYDEHQNYFDTSAVESVKDFVKFFNDNCQIVVAVSDVNPNELGNDANIALKEAGIQSKRLRKKSEAVTCL